MFLEVLNVAIKYEICNPKKSNNFVHSIGFENNFAQPVFLIQKGKLVDKHEDKLSEKIKDT